MDPAVLASFLKNRLRDEFKLSDVDKPHLNPGSEVQQEGQLIRLRMEFRVREYNTLLALNKVRDLKLKLDEEEMEQEAQLRELRMETRSREIIKLSAQLGIPPLPPTSAITPLSAHLEEDLEKERKRTVNTWDREERLKAQIRN